MSRKTTHSPGQNKHAAYIQRSSTPDSSAVRPFVQKLPEADNALLAVSDDKVGFRKVHTVKEYKESETRCIKSPPMPAGTAQEGLHNRLGGLQATVPRTAVVLRKGDVDLLSDTLRSLADSDVPWSVRGSPSLAMRSATLADAMAILSGGSSRRVV
ncbi:uncharacterized protein B0H18DRAFT_1117735 [Fomitopsis serialis]|uniref:uncharacterized protein n=1 Tax=Fomitopsis serialis TaxID=139415 RepID=UPI002008009E|nr:uncharacterized protein B0H18DRAFT_1117735 [Neoantrodia serialis]KAH9928918.1 hypothetical protein B0H18DRAFT_1117735 [Neoantrodia serialis]